MKKHLRISIHALVVLLLAHAAVSLGELQVHLKLDGNLVDSAGGDHNGRLIDGVRGKNQFVAGKLDQALDLQNGDTTTGGDGVSIQYTMTDSGTVALWFMPRRIYNYNTIYDNSVQQDDWECWIYQDGRLRARVESDNAVTANLNSLSSGGDPRDEWFHVAFMWNRTGDNTVDTTLCVNGALQDDNSGTWVKPGNTFYLAGGNPGNDFGDGTWDDVRIYDHVLSEVEIRSLAMKGLIVEPRVIQLPESQTAAYSLILDYPEGHEPKDDVFVTITADADLSINGRVIGESETLIFAPGAHLIPQTAHITAVDDSIYTGNRAVTLTHEVTSSDAYWNNMEDVQLDIFIIDNDQGCGDWGYMEMDFNRDCYVDSSDFALFAAQWLACTDPSGDMCQYRRDVVIVAHRGNSVFAPENTIASCNAARRFAHNVEFDVRETLDHKLVLMHDGTIDRTTNGTGAVENMTFSVLRELDAGSWFSPEFSGELVPLMSEAVLACLPDMLPFIERKTGSAARYVDLIRSLRIEDKAIVIAFDWNFLEELERLLPVIKTGALGSEALTLNEIRVIQSKGIDFINWAHSGVTTETIDLVHASGMDLHVWTVNDAHRMQTFIDSGIDGITTDNPQLARQLLDQQNN